MFMDAHGMTEPRNDGITEPRNHGTTEGQGESSIAPLFQSGAIITPYDIKMKSRIKN